MGNCCRDYINEKFISSNIKNNEFNAIILSLSFSILRVCPKTSMTNKLVGKIVEKKNSDRATYANNAKSSSGDCFAVISVHNRKWRCACRLWGHPWNQDIIIKWEHCQCHPWGPKSWYLLLYWGFVLFIRRWMIPIKKKKKNSEARKRGRRFDFFWLNILIIINNRLRIFFLNYFHSSFYCLIRALNNVGKLWSTTESSGLPFRSLSTSFLLLTCVHLWHFLFFTFLS